MTRVQARDAGAGRPAVPATFDLSAAGRALLAVLSAAAGVIHLAMVPSHWGSTVVEGAGFAVVGWTQIALAVVVLAAPSRTLLRIVMVVNVLAIGAWGVSRTWGLPIGDHAGHPHDVQFVDLVCVAIEVALVVLCGLWLSRPSFGGQWHGARLAMFALVPVAVLALATAALASPSARNHAHDSHGGHAHDGSLTAAAAAASGGAGCATTADEHTHCVATAPGVDKGFSALTNGHHHAIVWHDLDPATQAELDRQLDLTRQAAARYPTLADAVAAGYRPAGGYSPGAGIHYVGGVGGEARPDGSLSDETLLHPDTLLYDGTGPDARLAGLMFNVNTTVEPVGFVGTNDVWHNHTGLCIVFTEKGITTALSDEKDAAVKEQQCPLAGGRFVKQTGWMMHVWTVPGYDDVPGGVFAENNPLLACSDGTYESVPAAERVTPDNSCRSGAPGRPSNKTLAVIRQSLAQQ